jgi:hypothetical protein
MVGHRPNSTKCSGVQEKWSMVDEGKVDDDIIIHVACHINIHVSCHITQVDTFRMMCHATSSSMCHAMSVPKKWSMVDGQVGRFGKVFSTIIGDRRSSMGRWSGINQISEDFSFTNEYRSTTDDRVGWFGVVQISCRGIGSMVDGRVDRLGKELCTSKGKCRSSMVDRFRSTVVVSPDLSSTTKI